MASPRSDLKSATVIIVQTSSPRFLPSTPTVGANQKIRIAVYLSDESVFAVIWAVENYLRRMDVVVLVHVRTADILYGADWGAINLSPQWDPEGSEEAKRKLEIDFDSFTHSKAEEITQPLVAALFPFKIHILKDHDMKERLCLEVERLVLSTLIVGSRGFGAVKRSNNKGRLGSVSDYSVRYCVCPVEVVRFAEETDGGRKGSETGGAKTNSLVQWQRWRRIRNWSLMMQLTSKQATLLEVCRRWLGEEGN